MQCCVNIIFSLSNVFTFIFTHDIKNLHISCRQPKFGVNHFSFNVRCSRKLDRMYLDMNMIRTIQIKRTKYYAKVSLISNKRKTIYMNIQIYLIMYFLFSFPKDCYFLGFTIDYLFTMLDVVRLGFKI